MGQYFYNEGSSLKQIRKIENDYLDLAKAIQDISQSVGNYVCVDGRWFDDNAIIFAKWWNNNLDEEEGFDASLFGNLKWNESKKMLVTDTNNNTQDGSDRMVTLLNLAGKCFYIAVCKSLEALESSHKDVRNKCKKYLKVAQDSKYNLSKTGRIWRHLMIDDIFGDGIWTTLRIYTQTNSNGRKTSVAQLKNFQKEIETGLNKVEKCVETYCNDVNALANNTDTSKWWGFSDDVRTKVKKATKDCKTKSTARIKNFKKNLNLAITKIIEAKQGDLAKIKALDFHLE